VNEFDDVFGWAYAYLLKQFREKHSPLYMRYGVIQPEIPANNH